MIKKILSKKSGFTLVEIVVAFAIFAIMASMIMQILVLVSSEKSENAKFMETLAAQEEKLAADGKQKFTTQDGEVVLNFKDTSTPKKIAYDMKAANGDEEGIGDGLTYFVSKNSQEDSADQLTQPSDSNKGGEQGQMSAVDARITGSPKFKEIKIKTVQKAGEEYTGPGVCYLIELYALADPSMTSAEEPYAQFRLNFFTSEPFTATREYEDPDTHRVYTREEYPEATIIDAGYVNGSTLKWGTNCKSVVLERNIESGDYSYSPYYVAKTAPNTLRISSPYKNEGSSKRFVGDSFKIYVVFETDPNLTVDSFGHNSSGGSYTNFPMYLETYNSDGTCKYEQDGDKYSNYIYGAYMYKRVYK